MIISKMFLVLQECRKQRLFYETLFFYSLQCRTVIFHQQIIETKKTASSIFQLNMVPIIIGAQLIWDNFRIYYVTFCQITSFESLHFQSMTSFQNLRPIVASFFLLILNIIQLRKYQILNFSVPFSNLPTNFNYIPRYNQLKVQVIDVMLFVSRQDFFLN